MLLWVRRLKPFFDAYTGPYKDTHRYWTGLLLLVHVGLFLFFSMIQNVTNHPSLSLLAIIFVAVSLLFFQGMEGGVYKLLYMNIFEVLLSSEPHLFFWCKLIHLLMQAKWLRYT